MKLKKNLIVLLGTLLLLVVCINNKSYAVLQSNGGNVATKDVGSWMTQIRNMEAIGGGLGLTETINGKLIQTTETNNLDCHMEKNTEFGAMAILSASSYGNPEKIEHGGTTTGNQSGVKININKEWVAAGIMAACPAYANASGRYKNLYTAKTENALTQVIYNYKNGDAITETNGWHGSKVSTWISSTSTLDREPGRNRYNAEKGAGLLRTYSGSIFSYYGYSNSCEVSNDASDYERGIQDADFSKPWASRAVIVIGEGF